MSQPTEFNADATRHSLGFFAAFASLAIVSLAAAIDATIIAVALPVSFIDPKLSLPFLCSMIDRVNRPYQRIYMDRLPKHSGPEQHSCWLRLSSCLTG
jgi:hypothetical protein